MVGITAFTAFTALGLRDPREHVSMATLQVEPNLPELTQTHSLEGWRREFCIELLGDGAARIFERTVETGSRKANEQKRAILFHRLEPRSTDLAGCIKALRQDLESGPGSHYRAGASRGEHAKGGDLRRSNRLIWRK